MQDMVSFIEVLLAPRGTEARDRKVWGIGLETVLVPFLTATNAENKTAIPYEALGAPLRLQYNDDGTPKYSEKSGKPVIRVAKPISEQVRLMRENYVGYLQAHTAMVAKNNADRFNQERRLSLEAGKPILEADKGAVDRYDADLRAFLSTLKNMPKPEPEAVTV